MPQGKSQTVRLRVATGLPSYPDTVHQAHKSISRAVRTAMLQWLARAKPGLARSYQQGVHPPCIPDRSREYCGGYSAGKQLGHGGL